MLGKNSDKMVMGSSSKELLSTQLLNEQEVEIVAGVVDYKGRPAIRSKHGRWTSAAFLFGAMILQLMAYYGILANLINYLTGRLGMSTATAAANLNAWSGVTYMLPIFAALLADSFLGKYCTVITGCLLTILGMGMLTLSALLSSSVVSPHLQTMLFFTALYLVALGQGGINPCLQPFGADQFDGEHPTECQAQSSFFNWWFFGDSSAFIFGAVVMSYVQDNLDWAIGFGIPCIITVIALMVFFFGTSTYRFVKIAEEPDAISRIETAFVVTTRNFRSNLVEDKDASQTIQSNLETQPFRFLDKALVEPDITEGGSFFSESKVQEAKALLRLFPIWLPNLAAAIVISQIQTFFTKQAVMLDRSIGSSLMIPAAAFQSLAGIFIVVFIPIYDRFIVPVARIWTGKPAGISMLQRIGTGLFMCTLCMVVAAIVEEKRLTTALQYELIDSPDEPVPMSVWWLIPQYVLFGVADVFTVVGLQEFFYDQVPNELRSVGISLFYSILGTGQFLSSILVTLIDKATRGDGAESTSWFANNLNRAHLDYFYYLLAGLNSIALAYFIYFTKSYVYKKTKNTYP